MANTLDVEMRWGGTWHRSHKASVKPYIETALSLAGDAFEHFAIESSLPKVATVWQMSRTWPNSGESYDATNLDLNINHYDVRHRKVGKRMVFLATLAMHELAHCVRFERYQEATLVEDIASEGIAYTLSGAFAEELGLQDSMARRIYEGVKEFDPESIEELLVTLAEDVAKHTNTPKDIEESWMDNIDDRLAPGSVLGMHCVLGLLDSGMSWSDIFAMPAEDMIFNHVPGVFA